MGDDSFQCRLVTWEEAEELARRLAYSVMNSGYVPDLVIAIGRGGYVPARVVCDYMMQERLTSIRIEHWGVAASMKEEVKVTFPLSVDIEGKKVLIIDDVTDTGDTLVTATDYIGSLRPKEIRTGVLQHKTCSTFEPDYYSELVTEWKWIIYPWALHEDLVGFTEKVLTREYETVEVIGGRLSDRYGIVAGGERIAMSLEYLLVTGKAEKSESMFRKKRE